MTKTLAGVAVLLALTFAGSAASHTSGVTCTGQIVEIFAGFGTGGAVNGATKPTFSTGGQAYCLTAIQTYHWNGGKGQAPGTLGLEHVSGPAGFSTVGPFNAIGSAGQNNAPNVNWQANVPTSPNPTVIDGTYKCTDSDAATWSASTTGGPGFCNVYGYLAQGVAPPPAPAGPKAAAKEVVSSGGRIELIVKNVGTVPIKAVSFRAHNWIVEKLGAVQQKGICTINASDLVVCDKNFSIDPRASFTITILQSDGKNDGGYLFIGGSQLHIVVAGPEGSPPETPPAVTPQSRAENAIKLIDEAIGFEHEALDLAERHDTEKAKALLHSSGGKLYVAGLNELKGIPGLADAEAAVFRAERLDAGFLKDPKTIETALHVKTSALAEIRTFLAKKR